MMFNQTKLQTQNEDKNNSKKALNYTVFKQIAFQREMQTIEGLEQVKQEIRDAVDLQNVEKVETKIQELRTIIRSETKLNKDKEAINILNEYRNDGMLSLHRLFNLNDIYKLDLNEKTTLSLASTIGLTDEKTREKLYQEGLKGTLTPFQKSQIEQVQRGMQKDKKYSGEIDGKFGDASTIGLKRMILENRFVLDESVELSNGFKINGLLAESAKKIFEKVTSNNKLSAREADDLARSLSNAMESPDISNISNIKEVIEELWTVSSYLEGAEREEIFLKGGYSPSLGPVDFEVGYKEVDLSELENLTPNLNNLIKSNAIKAERN